MSAVNEINGHSTHTNIITEVHITARNPRPPRHQHSGENDGNSSPVFSNKPKNEIKKNELLTAIEWLFAKGWDVRHADFDGLDLIIFSSLTGWHDLHRSVCLLYSHFSHILSMIWKWRKNSSPKKRLGPIQRRKKDEWQFSGGIFYNCE